MDRAGRTRGAVAVIGGGLAGMTAALELVTRGFDVTLYEASQRLGGKAGSDVAPDLYSPRFELDPAARLPDGVASDHGYHVFPQWYTNMRRLWPRIGIDADRDVYAGQHYLDLKPAVAGQRRPFEPEPYPSLRQVMAICDLLLQPDGRVDRLTLQAFLHSRDYCLDDAPISLNDFILNALTIGDADISSRVARNVFRQWLPVFTRPNWDALRGSLGEILIDRLEAAIASAADAAGTRFEVRYGHTLVDLQPDPGFTVRATLRTADGACTEITDQAVVMAVPPEVLRRLDGPALFDAGAEIHTLHYLRANPFSALDVHFTERLPAMPDEHFTLTGSPYGLTGFDISRHWPRLQRGPTVLQFVAADSRGFTGLDDATFVRVLATEIARYLPELSDRVAFYVPHRNMDVPLFVNDVGSWTYRPEVRSGQRNLYLAGDYVRNETEVTSMEAAVRTGLMAAEALRQDHAPDTEAVHIEAPMAVPEGIRQLIDDVWPEDPMRARLECFAWFKAQFDAMRTGG